MSEFEDMKTPFAFIEYFRVILYFAGLVCLLILASGRQSLAKTIQIDSAWLAAHAPSPYHLTGRASTYVLQTDVTTGGTAFFFDDDQIVFDLNGHTITYANLDFTGVLNRGFETGVNGNPNLPLNWDLSSAPHGHRQDSLARLYFDDYSLRLENPSGDALAEESALSSPVKLPAPGRYAAIAQVHGGPSTAIHVRLAVEGISTMLDNKVSNMPPRLSEHRYEHRDHRGVRHCSADNSPCPHSSGHRRSISCNCGGYRRG
jgi:hypothetical protein